MHTAPTSVDVDLASFPQVVIENSHRVPVLVDFWADWCSPCKMLMPILQQVVESLPGQVLLAKVNSDAQQELAAHYGVRSLPTVKLFRHGEVVKGFTGVQSEAVIRELLQPYLPRSSDHTVTEALTAYSAGRIDEALGLLETACRSDPDNDHATLTYAQLLAEQGHNEQALTLVKGLPLSRQLDTEVKALMSRLEFSLMAGVGEDIEGLRARLAAAPGDNTTRFLLANLLIAQGDYEAGLQHLMEVLRRDVGFKDGAAKATLLKVFEMLGNSGPLVGRYRSQLYNLLY